jgi:hypothetical protein
MTAIFTPHDRAEMMAAAEGVSPSDWDADPGDPENGPSPYIVSGVGTWLEQGAAEFARFFETGVRVEDPWPQQPFEGPAHMRAMNDSYHESGYEFRYDKHYRRLVRG